MRKGEFYRTIIDTRKANLVASWIDLHPFPRSRVGEFRKWVEDESSKGEGRAVSCVGMHVSFWGPVKMKGSIFGVGRKMSSADVPLQ